MTTAPATATWPTQAELDAVMRRVEVAAGDMDELDVRLSALSRDGVHHANPELVDIGALARFIELVGMDLKVLSDGSTDTQHAMHLGITETWEDPRAR